MKENSNEVRKAFLTWTVINLTLAELVVGCLLIIEFNWDVSQLGHVARECCGYILLISLTRLLIWWIPPRKFISRSSVVQTLFNIVSCPAKFLLVPVVCAFVLEASFVHGTTETMGIILLGYNFILLVGIICVFRNPK